MRIYGTQTNGRVAIGNAHNRFSEHVVVDPERLELVKSKRDVKSSPLPNSPPTSVQITVTYTDHTNAYYRVPRSEMEPEEWAALKKDRTPAQTAMLRQMCMDDWALYEVRLWEHAEFDDCPSTAWVVLH
jgi:hypothetical protein